METTDKKCHCEILVEKNVTFVKTFLHKSHYNSVEKFNWLSDTHYKQEKSNILSDAIYFIYADNVKTQKLFFIHSLSEADQRRSLGAYL